MKYLNYTIQALLLMSFISTAQAQCDEYRHSTSWFDGWVSCERAPHPIPDLSRSHWIQYDLGAVYRLGRSHFWNINDPANLDVGIARYRLDYSEDGLSWNSLGEYDLAQGSGRSVYAGAEAADFGGVEARYVVITALETHGALCAGLAEVRIELASLTDVSQEVASQEDNCLRLRLSPHPLTGDGGDLYVENDCGAEVRYAIYTLDGRLVTPPTRLDASQSGVAGIGRSLAAGSYFLKASTADDKAEASLKIIKVD